MRTLIGIPARMGASRFPGKPLKPILGLSLIGHVVKRCELSKYGNDVFVATCDDAIADEVRRFGGTAVMTPADIERPGLRVAYATARMALDPKDIVAIVQGDEPLIRPEMIDLGIDTLIANPELFCVNLGADITAEEIPDINEVKVVTDLWDNAMYMSRCPIPYARETAGTYMKQLGIFFFRAGHLAEFQELEPTALERSESIEMNRAIQHRKLVRMVRSPFPAKGVDTAADLEFAERLMREDPIYPKYASPSSGV